MRRAFKVLVSGAHVGHDDGTPPKRCVVLAGTMKHQTMMKFASTNGHWHNYHTASVQICNLFSIMVLALVFL